MEQKKKNLREGEEYLKLEDLEKPEELMKTINYLIDTQKELRAWQERQNGCIDRIEEKVDILNNRITELSSSVQQTHIDFTNQLLTQATYSSFQDGKRAGEEEQENKTLNVWKRNRERIAWGITVILFILAVIGFV